MSRFGLTFALVLLKVWFTDASSFFLTSTGFNGSPLNTSEVWNILKGSTCGHVTDYPLKVTSAYGQIILGRITICGGIVDERPISNCYSYDPDQAEWQPFPPLPKAMARGASAVMPNGSWWLADGSSLETVVFNPEEGWNSGHRMLESIEHMCMLTYNETFVFTYARGAHFYTMETGAWVDLPRAPFADTNHPKSCVQLDDGRILLAGNCMEETQVFDPRSNQWIPGPLQPFRICHPGLLSLDGQVVMIGGYTTISTPYQKNTVYEWIDDSWFELPFRLEQARANAVVLEVDPSVVTQC